MRLGGMVPPGWRSAEEWASNARGFGYGAVVFPLDHKADTSEIDRYVSAARDHDLLIAEVGVWNNVLAQDLKKREEAIRQAVRQLELADYVGALCCVNIAGSFSDQWDGPHPDNLSERGFDATVLATQKIIDTAHPVKTEYSLEPMPWMYPTTPEEFLRLIEAVDRRSFGVHLDIVNTINSIERYFNITEWIHHWFDVLGHRIVSCHAKDITLRGDLTVHLDEVRPGTGAFDYAAFFTRIKDLSPDTCVMFEHMTDIEDYRRSLDFAKQLANELGIEIR